MAMDPRERGEARLPTLGKAPVIYYLSRSRRLEHPHFVQVPLSSPHGLYLKDVIHKLNSVRGNGMANMYSWSSKRRYKNGYVWQDLGENDLIQPSHGNEYILKGSERLEKPLNLQVDETLSSSSGEKSKKLLKSGKMKVNSKSEFDDYEEYIVYKVIDEEECKNDGYNNKSTQTDDHIRTNPGRIWKSEGGSEGCVGSADIRDQSSVNDRPSGRMKPSQLLIQLVTCGARKVKDRESVVFEH